MFKFLIVALLTISSAQAAITISSPAGTTSPITIKTCDSNAGAICSLVQDGKEFINHTDHGRLLQSASSFDGKGEAFNPTEGGSVQNGYSTNPSSSVLLYGNNSASALTTISQMAFWLPTGGVRLSNHVLKKTVKIGLTPDMPNVIEYVTEFTIPLNEHHTFATFEALTGYMPKDFSFWTTSQYINGADHVSHIFVNPSNPEQPLPLIFSTVDGSHAMAIFSPDSPQQEYPAAGYGRWAFPDCVKWNSVFRISNPIPGATYKFRSYVVVGDYFTVRKTLIKLNQYFWK